MPSVGLYQRYRLYRRAVRLGSRVAPRDIARVQRLQSSIPLVRSSLILVRHRPTSTDRDRVERSGFRESGGVG